VVGSVGSGVDGGGGLGGGGATQEVRRAGVGHRGRLGRRFYRGAGPLAWRAGHARRERDGGRRKPCLPWSLER
jgi:hypothetical protein